MTQLHHWSLPFSEAFGVFLLHCRSQRFRKSTIEFYNWRLPPFADWLQRAGVTELQQVTANHVRAYVVERQDAGAAPNYVHGIARALRAFFNFCVNEEWLERSPMKTVAMPKRPRKILPAFDAGELKRLQRAEAGERVKAIVLFLLDTGLRASEVLAVNGGDIDLRTGTVLVRSGKGDKPRTVHMGSKTIRTLLRYYVRRGQPAPNAPVWITEREPHSRLTYAGLAQLLRRLGKAAIVPDCTAHRFRRTFAIECLRNGMNIYSLQKLMGHEDLATLRQYLDMVESDAEQAHRQYGVVDNL